MRDTPYDDKVGAVLKATFLLEVDRRIRELEKLAHGTSEHALVEKIFDPEIRGDTVLLHDRTDLARMRARMCRWMDEETSSDYRSDL